MSPEEELRALVDQQPDEVARLLRTWLADRRAVAR
jgi:flagellar biosynthesis/type III secretory pathway M-ring protein FliF/YscJ